MKKISILLSALLLIFNTGCASRLMSSCAESSTPIANDQSTITFFRSSIWGYGIQAPIVEEVREGQLDLVGINSVDTKIRQVVKAGNHTYIVGGESAYLLIAKIDPNKHYYVRVSPCMGWFKARFKLEPIASHELANGKVQQEISNCDLVKKIQMLNSGCLIICQVF